MKSLIRWILLAALNFLAWGLVACFISLLSAGPQASNFLYYLMLSIAFALGLPSSLLVLVVRLDSLLPVLILINPFLWATMVELALQWFADKRHNRE